MDDSLSTCEVVSDLMDGRLRDQAFSNVVQTVLGDAQARQAWHAYHVVGDVLRSADLAPSARDDGFLSRFQERMQVQVALRPEAAVDQCELTAGSPTRVALPDTVGGAAANDPGFAWRGVAGFASLLAVVALGWNMLGDIASVSPAPQLASVPQPSHSRLLAGTAQEGQVMLRDPRLDQLLMAHRQSGGASALQVPSGFLRNATFEVPGRQGLQK